MHIVVLTGAGMSADSGLKTFRDSDGLWEGHDVMEVASIEGWQRNPDLVLDFYNQRRKQSWSAKPNDGHLALAKLEEHFKVSIITQNVDSLHEKAGSSNVIHLHGELKNVRSTIDENLVYNYKDKPILKGDLCEKGGQLRPDIVWFGEPVPMIETAAEIVSTADIFIIIGTSLVVYPAAGLVSFVPLDVPVYQIDPGSLQSYFNVKVTHIKETSARGTPKLVEKLINEYKP